VISARGLAARVGAFELAEVTFEVPRGGYGVVIGPAGSGKTTLLEAVAGITPMKAGSLQLNGVDAHDAPPESRDLALVYQQAFLFPHLSVRENIAYGSRDAAQVAEMCERFAVGALLERSVVSLSGGERQLVALARAFARRSSIVLLDEPFSALDPRRRAATRREVRALHRERGFTALQVTHDFTEAGLLGDVAILLDGGRVLQYGPPDAVFRKPKSPYIAEFLGAENVLAGTSRVLADTSPDWTEPLAPDAAAGYHAIEFTTGPLTIYAVGVPVEGAGYAVIRAEEVVLSPNPMPSSARNVFRGRVSEVATAGAFARVTLEVEGVPLVAALTTRSVQELGLAPGVEAWATFKAMAVHLC
jgi:molybdopterin-binding protein